MIEVSVVLVLRDVLKYLQGLVNITWNEVIPIEEVPSNKYLDKSSSCRKVRKEEAQYRLIKQQGRLENESNIGVELNNPIRWMYKPESS